MEPFFKFDEKRCDKLTAESPSAGAHAAFKGNCTIGAFSYAGAGCVFTSTTIGRYCSIAANVLIGPSQHPTDRFTTHLITFGSAGPFKGSDEFGRLLQNRAHPRNKKQTVVGNDVWIGANVSIMRGVTVGDGAVIGSGSVVTKDVPPYAIVGGVPAKTIRYRFEQATIDRLMTLQWWSYDLNHPEITDIDFSDIRSFIYNFGQLLKNNKLTKLNPIGVMIGGNAKSEF